MELAVIVVAAGTQCEEVLFFIVECRDITSAFLGINSQNSSILRSPKLVCIVSDYIVTVHVSILYHGGGIIEEELSEDNDTQEAPMCERTNTDSYQIENKHHQLSNRLRLRVEHLVRSEGLGRRIERALLVDHVHVCHVSH